jgi:general stress protein YciG
MTNLDDAVKQYLAEMASKGGKARAAKFDRATLSKWAKKGGRPPKKGSQKGTSK